MRLYPRKVREWMMSLMTVLLFLMLPLAAGLYLFWMPGRSHTGPLPPVEAGEAVLAHRLRGHVETLAGRIGERHLGRPEALEAAADYIEGAWEEGGYPVSAQFFTSFGRSVKNLEVEISGGQPGGEIVVVGAHYDTVPGTPGGNDNGSGVAVLLELSRLLRDRPLLRTVRLVAFVNEEPPFFQTSEMGSRHYARRCRERGEPVVAMVALESLGIYRDEPGSQAYPAPLLGLLYPERGDFVAFVGNLSSAPLLRRSIGAFRRTVSFPSRGLAAPAGVPGIAWSDQWSFWQEGIPAIMATDTSLFRDRNYHGPGDRPERIDYDRLARVTLGLAGVASELAGEHAR